MSEDTGSTPLPEGWDVWDVEQKRAYLIAHPRPFGRGWVYACSEPENFGRMPVRSDIEVRPRGEESPPMAQCTVVAYVSPGKREMAEFGSIALRIPVGGRGQNNTVGPEWTLAEEGTVLVPAGTGGFYMVPLKKNAADQWYVTCGDADIPVEWDEPRQCWVVRTLPE